MHVDASGAFRLFRVVLTYTVKRSMVHTEILIFCKPLYRGPNPVVNLACRFFSGYVAEGHLSDSTVSVEAPFVP
jgi:hypothetical protein